MKEIKGKTLVRLDIDSETEIIRDDHTGVFVGAYQTKQIGSLLSLQISVKRTQMPLTLYAEKLLVVSIKE